MSNTHRWQYQREARPLSQESETITLDKWFQPASIPQRRKRNYYFAQQSFFWDANTPSAAEVVTLDKWLAQPPFVITKKHETYRYPYLFVPERAPNDSEAFLFLSWKPVFPDQTYGKSPTFLRRDFTVSPDWATVVAPPEEITLDKWFQQLSEPIRLGRLRQPWQVGAHQISPAYFATPSVSEWMQPIAQPVFIKEPSYLRWNFYTAPDWEVVINPPGPAFPFTYYFIERRKWHRSSTN